MNRRLRNRNTTIMGTQYFLYFGVLGIFLPYFNLYCYHIGLSGFEIGAVSALRAITFSLFPLLWGVIADRFGIRRPIYIFCNFAGMGIWCFYFITPHFRPMMVITFFYGLFYSPIISFLEAATMETLAHEKSRYGRVRVWGSISFILSVICIGELTDLYTTRIVLYFIFVLSLLQSVFSLGIPKVSVPAHPKNARPDTPLFTRNLIMFLVSGFLMLVSHGTYYGFFSIHLESLQCSKLFIGIAWALAVVAEIVVMVNSRKLFQRFSLEGLLFCSFLIATGRWLALFLFTAPLIILVSQIAHAFTYGTFHMASILYMDALSNEKAKTFGQAVNNAVTYGLGLVAGFFLTGALYESIGARFLFLISAGAALTGGIVFRYGGETTRQHIAAPSERR